MLFRTWAGQQIEDATRYWWVLLVSGAVWIILALAILQFNLTSVWSIAILTGIVLLVASLSELAMTAIAPSWRWAHGLLAVLFLIGAILAFAWPHSTFVVLARLISWYLLFLGTFEVIEALTFRRTELWWLRLIGGAATIGIGFWAADSLDRSAAVLILWVGLGVLFRGVDQIFLAFEFRNLHEGAKWVGSGKQPAPPARDSVGSPAGS